MTLGDIMAACDIGDTGALPHGASDLDVREMRFVSCLLVHGNQARAYQEAGYEANGDAAAVGASKLLRKPKVYRFFQQCLKQLANNADETLARVMERARILHSQATEAASVARECEEELTRIQAEESGSGVAVAAGTGAARLPSDGMKAHAEMAWKLRATLETRREQAIRRQAKLMKLANDTDALLASLLGKLQLNVNVTGDGLGVAILQGKKLDAEALQQLAQARRDEATQWQRN